MRRPTHAELTAEVALLQRSESLLSVALNLIVNNRPNATERVRIAAGEYYTFKLYGARRADGGMILETFHCKGQQPHSAVRYLDDMLSIANSITQDLRIRCALERLGIARNRLLNEPTNAESGAFDLKATA